MREKPYLEVFRKNGEMDFGISGHITSLDLREMDELRKMLVVAIGTAEGMWRRANQEQQGQAVTSAQPGAE